MTLYDYSRASIDTLYLGLKTDELEGYDIFDEIKKNLSLLAFVKVKDNKRGNTYYWHTEGNKDEGCYFCIEPRGNLLNDFITLQFGGKFFRDIEGSEKFIDWLFEKYSSLINIQRIDVALDICFKNYPYFLDSDSRVRLCGFPIPHYSVYYNYKKLNFEFYGRTGSEFSQSTFINMISQGKGDTRLRVYDKTLDILEKTKGDNYSIYYALSENFEQVYRIEFQARGQRLKGFIADYLDEYKTFSRKHLIDVFLNYIFYKYEFENVISKEVIDEFRKPYRFVKIKKEKSLERELAWHRARQNSEFLKCCDIVDKITLQREIDKVCLMAGKLAKGKELKSFKFDIVDFYEMSKGGTK